MRWNFAQPEAFYLIDGSGEQPVWVDQPAARPRFPAPAARQDEEPAANRVIAVLRSLASNRQIAIGERG